jgi:SAM-dependent methyltransferase
MTGPQCSHRSQTETSFFDKWRHNRDLAFRATLDEESEIYRWILTRNGFADRAALAAYLAAKRRVLDAGCGNGRVTALLRSHSDPATTEIVGIDLTAAEVAAKNLAGAPNVRIEAGDLLGPLGHLGRFDLIYCQEVLHHTGDAARGFANLCGLLADDGEIAIYVYKQKAPAREFVDEYVRKRIKDMAYEDAMTTCRAIAEIGRALSDVKGEIAVPQIEVLGIEAGRYSVQRFVYHFFMKCFWNDRLSFEENAVINYDWYHPELATRHTPAEVRGWFRDAGLEIVHEHVDPYGVTVRGVRRSAGAGR